MRGTSVIHRLSAVWGLAALAPVAVLLFQDELSLLEAGVRALAILAGVVCIRWITDRVVRGIASSLDRRGDGEPTAQGGSAPRPSSKPVATPPESA